MSCFAKIKSPLNGKSITSPAYYQLTSFFPADQGKKIYAATTTATFKRELGFDWTKRQAGYSTKLNFAGEPNIDEINAHLRLGMTSQEIKAAQQIEEVASLGYLNVGYKNPNAFDTIVNEINLNPKYNLIDSEVLVRDGKHYLSVKPVLQGKIQKPISKVYLQSLNFPDMLLNNVADFNNASLFELLTNLQNNKQLSPFQQKMVQRLSSLMRINPTLKLTVFDDAEVDEEYQRSFYDPNTNTVYIGKTISSGFNTERFVQDLIHEAVHAYTISALTNPRTPEEIKFRQEIEKYLGEYRRLFPRLQHHYGFKNIEEFVSEYLSNPYFREDLQEAEKNKKERTFIERIVGGIKRFLSTVLGKDFSIFNQVQETIDNYFDYLENLEDMPDLAGEIELRFSAPYNSAPPVPPDSPNIERFKRYVDATFTSSAWKQISQSLSEIDPRFNSIERIKEKFGNLSTLSLGSAIKSSIDYLQVVDQLLDRLYKDVELHKDNLGYFSSEDAVSVFNHAMNVADFLADQIQEFEATLLPELQLDLTRTDLETDPTARAKFLQQRQISIQDFQNISKEVAELISTIDKKSKNLKDLSKKAILAPVASQLAEPFRLVAEKLQAPDSDLNKEIAYKEKMLAQAEAAKQTKRIADIKKDLQELYMLRSWVPSRENILKLLQSGVDPQYEYKGASFWNVYLDTANAVGSPIVQTVKQFLDVHLTEAENKSIEHTRRAEKLRDRIEQRNKKNGIGILPKSMASFYQGFTREVDMVYYDDNGVRKVVRQVAYNTRFKEAEFRNDLQELERNVEKAIENGVEAEITAAEQKLQKFLETYAVKPYTDEYYEAEDLLIDDAREARQDLLQQLEEHQAMFGDSELDDITREKRADLRRQYERLGSIYNEDGSEKPKGSKERAIADSIIAYKNKRKSIEAIEFVIPEKVRLRFEIEKNSRVQKVITLERKVALLQTQINDGLSLGEDVSAFQEELTETQFRLGQAEAERDKWLDANSRTEISPEFFEKQRSIAEQIKAIFLKYGEDPLLTEAYEDLFNSVKGYRDNNGVIIGNQIQRGLSKTIKDIEDRIEDLKTQAEENRNISEDDKKLLKQKFKELNDLQSKETTVYYRETYAAIYNQIDSNLSTEKDTMDKIDELAVKYADNYIETSGIDEAIELDDQLPEVRHPSEFGTDKHRNELINAFKLKLRQQIVEQRMKQSDWYKANHITITKTYIDKKGQKVTYVKTRPIYIWNRTIPRNQGYILRNSPNFDWALPRVREEYKNKDYNFLGNARPRMVPNSPYINPEYDKLSDEEKGIMDDMVSLYEDEQRDLPRSQRLEGYTIPNMLKEDQEQVMDLYTRPLAWLKHGAESFKLFFSSGKPGDNLDESNVLDDVTNKKLISQGRKVQLIKTRYKEPLNVNQVSLNLLGGLAMYGSYTAQFAGLKKAMPAVFAARDIASEKFPPNDIKMLDEELQRFFYGEETTTSILGNDSELSKKVVRVLQRIFRFSQKRVLLFNISRLFKNIFTNMMRIVLKRNRYGFTRMELLKAWMKGFRKRRSLLQLELGSKRYSEYALKLIHFRAVPAADPTKMAGNIHQSGMYKYFNWENFSAQIYGYTESASTIPIYEAFMARTTVPMTINGVTTNIPLDQAYEVLDGVLVPKDGVFELNLSGVRNLVDQRKQTIAQFLLSKGLNKVEDLKSSDRIALKELLSPIDIKIASIEAQNKPKLEKLRLIEQYVRDNIHDMYTQTQGNYFGRSRSAYEKRLWATILMSMRRWLFPSLKNLYGEKRISLYSGRIEEGFYKGGGRSLIRKLRYLANKERLNLGYTEIEKQNHATIARDTLNALGLHFITLGLTSLALAGADDDDEESNFLLGTAANVSFGTYLEYVTINPVITVPNLIYKFGWRDPLDKPGDEQGATVKALKYLIHAVTGATLNSVDQTYDALFDWKNFTDPFGEYYVQRREAGGISEFYTPKATKGMPRIAAVGMRVYGVESGLKSFLEPKRKLQDMLRLNPMIGLPDPLGDYVQLEKRMIEVKKEMFARNIEDIKYFESGNWDKVSKPVFEEKGKLLLEYTMLSVKKQVMESSNSYLRKAKLEKDISSYEGQEEKRRLDDMMEFVIGTKEIKLPKDEKFEFEKKKEKAWNDLNLELFKQSASSFTKDLQSQNMNPD